MSSEESNLDLSRFLNASQDAIVRLDLDATPNDIEGLMTDGLYCCLAFILQSTNGHRISLIHASLMYNHQAVIDECRWVTPPLKITTVRGSSYEPKYGYHNIAQFNRQTFPRLKEALANATFLLNPDITVYSESTENVAVTRKGVIVSVKLPDFGPPTGQFPPLAELRDKTNLVMTSSLNNRLIRHGFDLQFDGYQWTAFPVIPDTSNSFLWEKHYFNAYQKIEKNIAATKDNAIKAFEEKRYEDAVTGFADYLAWIEHHTPKLDEELMSIPANYRQNRRVTLFGSTTESLQSNSTISASLDFAKAPSRLL